jgi:hypothetical protein
VRGTGMGEEINMGERSQGSVQLASASGNTHPPRHLRSVLQQYIVVFTIVTVLFYFPSRLLLF